MINDEETPDPTLLNKKNDPRTRLDRRGARCLSDVDLLAVLLESSSSAKESARDISKRIIDKVDGSIYRLSRWTVSDFVAEKFSWPRACTIVAAFELSRRFEDRMEIAARISSARDVFDFFEKTSIGLDREKCWVISLDVKNQFVRYDEVSAGTATSSIFHPRDFLRPAVRCNASSIILVHNHPSGDATPSQGDADTTERLRDAGKVLGIKLLDHVIIGRRNVGAYPKGFFSFSEAGRL